LKKLICFDIILLIYCTNSGPWSALSSLIGTRVGPIVPFLAKFLSFSKKNFFAHFPVSPSEVNFSRRRRRRHAQTKFVHFNWCNTNNNPISLHARRKWHIILNLSKKSEK
jgi:hypothetical protein